MAQSLLARAAFSFLLATTAVPAWAQSAAPPTDPAPDRAAINELLAVDEYILRIQALDDNGPKLNAVIDYDPAAPVAARLRLGVGPLHGRTVLVKDNIETKGFATTGAASRLRTTGRAAMPR